MYSILLQRKEPGPVQSDRRGKFQIDKRKNFLTMSPSIKGVISLVGNELPDVRITG